MIQDNLTLAQLNLIETGISQLTLDEQTVIDVLAAVARQREFLKHEHGE